VSDVNAGTLTTDDVVQPFQIENTGLRGRMVRMGPLLDEILGSHAYPEPVAQMLGETVVLAAILASALKYDGVFTLQTKGDGPVAFMVADVTSGGDIRGYARFDRERLAAAPATGVSGLLGQGHLAFTVDQGEHTERYQGIVALAGESLAECVTHYFRQSEQLQTGIKLAVGRQGGHWRGAGLMLQRMPDPSHAAPASDREDDWRRAMILMDSATDAELLDPALPSNDLLFRLFHEDGVRVWAPSALRAKCRCSRDRVAGALAGIPRSELDDLKVDGHVSVTCEFCNRTYRFDDADLNAIDEQR